MLTGSKQPIKLELESSNADIRLLQFILENASDSIYIFDDAGRIIYANEMASHSSGYSKDELLSMSVSDLDPVGNRKHLRLLATTADQAVFETSHRTKSGQETPVEISHAGAMFDGKIYNSAFVRDISERVEDKVALREGEERFRAISDASPVALIINRISDGCIQYANKQAELLFEKTQEELIGTTMISLFEASQVDRPMLEAMKAGKEFHNREVSLEHSELERVWVSINSRSLDIDGDQVVCSAMLDVTEARELSNELSYQATYDDLTGLVNRREFENRLRAVIGDAARRGSQNALCYLDLDQFKIINDTCGHMAGDELLRQLSHLLLRGVRRDDTLARLGGDEFGILLANCPIENAELVAQNVRKAIQDFRFVWQENTFNVGVSIGLTPIAQEGESVTDALRRADSACYAAKDAGRNRVHLFRFDDAELARRDGEMRWVSRINAALDEDRLELWQQEIARIGKPTDETHPDARSHFELLLRMRDESDSLVMPGAFLPAAERYDLASKIDRWVVKETFRWFAHNPAELEKLGMCAINLSGQTLSDESFLAEVTALFENTRTQPEKICFEITETAAIANLSQASKFMHTLKNLGCSFALDDFGSGLSSFAYLKNLPVDYVKIDGFFVKDVVSDAVDLAMVKAINDMAHAMGKLTIAEFVEDEDILEELIFLGVDFVQGYGVSKPSPFSRF